MVSLLGCGDGVGEGDSATALPLRSATALSQAIRDGEITSSDLLELYLSRVAAFNPTLNAVVAFDVEGARQRARDADRALLQGQLWGPLHGLPITIKDAFEVVGMPTTSGVLELEDYVPERNAGALQRLMDAGAIVFGKTNVPALTRDTQTYNDVYGTTNNPWDLDRTPGGSSGGAAVAVAAGLVAFELGSDIGGSIRTPSHYTGIHGHKPSFGIVPREGHIPPLPGTDAVPNNLNVVGPLARSAEDLELLLDVLTDGRGETGPVELLPPRRQRLEDYRVAVWLTDPRVAVDDEVLDVLEPMVERLREAGARIDVEGRPDFSLAENHETYFALLIADVAGLPPEAGLLAHQDEQRRKWEAFFRDYDVLLCPVTPTVAFPHDQSEPMFTRTILVNGEPQPYMDFLVWAGLATLSGLPATAAPVGLSASGLPVGVQIVGAFMEDRTTLDFARRLASVVGGFRAPPGY